MLPQRKKLIKHEEYDSKKIYLQNSINKNKKVKSVIAIGTIFVIGLFVLSRFVYIVELNYQLESLKREYAQINRQNNDIKLQIADLRSLGRINSIAKEELGMIKPKKDNIVYVKHSLSSDDLLANKCSLDLDKLSKESENAKNVSFWPF